MDWLLKGLQAAAVLAAAGILGSWFRKEVREARAAGRPWYTPYLTAPGLLVVLAVLLPLLIWMVP